MIVIVSLKTETENVNLSNYIYEHSIVCLVAESIMISSLI